jgi:hypothetical protein
LPVDRRYGGQRRAGHRPRDLQHRERLAVAARLPADDLQPPIVDRALEQDRRGPVQRIVGQ